MFVFSLLLPFVRPRVAALPAAPHTTADFVGANFPAVAAAAAGVPAGREPLSPGLVEMDAETETNTRPLPLKETLPGDAETFVRWGGNDHKASFSVGNPAM